MVVLACLAVLAGAGGVSAQGQGNQTGVSVTRLSDLTFGSLMAGVPTQVLPGDATAAQFEVDAPKDTNVFLSVQTPSSLSSGSATLPVTFDASSAEWSDKNRTTGRTTFDPAQGTQVTMPKNGRVFVWVGGTASPPMSQPSGDYTGTLTLTAVAN